MSPAPAKLSIAIANEQRTLRIDKLRIRRVVKAILVGAEIAEAQISIAIVGDPAIAALHSEFMDDPSPTDVLSFVLEAEAGRLEGEVVASADTAAAIAPKYGWPPEDELLLYIVHGMLHLVGHDDGTSADRAKMRRAEKAALASVGCIKPPKP